MCSCILSSWGNGIPLNKLFTLGGRLFNPPKRKHVLKRAESHRCEVNILGTFAKGLILENCLQNMNGVTDFKFESRNTAMRRRTTANMCEIKKYIFLNFAHICCCSSSHCGVPALKLINELSLQASSDPTSDIGIVSFSFSIYFDRF